ncbi:MAG: stage 0 sporulation family protein [Dehalococcoidia bacterium]|nr:stage 0 sporulation family protein [Dehalococcoidia bacterium]
MPSEEAPQEHTRIVGVRFQQAGKIYSFNSHDLDINTNDNVVVRTRQGEELAQVVIPPEQVLTREISEPLKPVLRKATQNDIQKMQELNSKEKEILSKCRTLIDKLNLSKENMKPVKAKYNLNGTHLTIFFRAEKRIDFRQLVRELASTFKTRVELRQIGPRDETKLLGILGMCGRPSCCSTFLTNFTPLSIKLAKQQNLPLNPTKISGVCGHLLCCLRYEEEFYRTAKEKMPRKGQLITTPQGPANVIQVDLFRETVTARLEQNGSPLEFNLSDITLVKGTNPPETKRRRRKNRPPLRSP